MHFNPDIRIRTGACLPHWTKDGSIYAMRFRLADSLPQGTLKKLDEERKNMLQRIQKAGKPLSQVEREKMQYLFSQKIEKYLDAGYGACWMQRDAVAQIVANALHHFHEEQYLLSAWCIMPNHVHVVLQPTTRELRDIAYSWKKFTAIEANKLLKRKGAFWQS